MMDHVAVKIETLSRQIACLDQQRSLPVEAVSDAAVRQFGAAVSSALRISAKGDLVPGFAQKWRTQ